MAKETMSQNKNPTPFWRSPEAGRWRNALIKTMVTVFPCQDVNALYRGMQTQKKTHPFNKRMAQEDRSFLSAANMRRQRKPFRRQTRVGS